MISQSEAQPFLTSKTVQLFWFLFLPCILILSKFIIHQQMRKWLSTPEQRDTHTHTHTKDTINICSHITTDFDFNTKFKGNHYIHVSLYKKKNSVFFLVMTTMTKVGTCVNSLQQRESTLEFHLECLLPDFGFFSVPRRDWTASHRQAQTDPSQIGQQLMDHDLDPWKCIHIYKEPLFIFGPQQWHSWLRHCARQVWFPMVLEFFIDIILLATLHKALGSTQPLSEVSTRNISWGVTAASA